MNQEYPPFLEILVAQVNALTATCTTFGKLGLAHPLDATIFCVQGLIDQIVAAVPIDAKDVHPNVQRIHGAAVATQKVLREHLNSSVILAPANSSIKLK